MMALSAASLTKTLREVNLRRFREASEIKACTGLRSEAYTGTPQRRSLCVTPISDMLPIRQRKRFMLGRAATPGTVSKKRSSVSRMPAMSRALVNRA